MNRALPFVLALALLIAQYAAQMHSMSHLRHDLLVAKYGEKHAPPLGHTVDKCIAFHALYGTITGGSTFIAPPCVAASPDTYFVVAIPFPPRIVFDSRAPPVLS
jgi:hypothetical protein